MIDCQLNRDQDGSSWSARRTAFLVSLLYCAVVSWVQTTLSLSAAEPIAMDAGPAHFAEGLWRWNFTMPNGTLSRPKLFLYLEDGQLRGTSSFRVGNEAGITNTSINGNQIRFQVIRKKGSQTVVTTYSGLVAEKSIKGTITSNWTGVDTTYDWLAEKSADGIEGDWSWPVTALGRPATFRISLKQDGETVTGRVAGRAYRVLRIRNGSFKNGDVAFDIETRAPQNRIVTKYTGKLSGDKIKGSFETTIAGKKQKTDWEAKRSW